MYAGGDQRDGERIPERARLSFRAAVHLDDRRARRLARASRSQQESRDRSAVERLPPYELLHG
jgi:hypothetical protein